MAPAGEGGIAPAVRSLAMRSRSRRAVRLETVRRGGQTASKRMKRAAATGLASRADGGGVPVALTGAGRRLALAYDLGIPFFEACVLAKVYGAACSMAAATGGIDSGGGGGRAARTAAVPLRTVQYFFEDWPVYPGRVQHALSRLRRLGFLPRSRYKLVTCDMARLAGIRADLMAVSDWVDGAGEAIRRVLLHGD